MSTQNISTNKIIPIYSIPEKIPAEVIQWLTWRYDEPYTNNHELFLKYLSVVKTGFKNNDKYFFAVPIDTKKSKDFEIAIVHLIKILDDNDIVFINNCNYIFFTKNAAREIIRLYDRSFRNIIATNINLELLSSTLKSTQWNYKLFD